MVVSDWDGLRDYSEYVEMSGVVSRALRSMYDRDPGSVTSEIHGVVEVSGAGVYRVVLCDGYEAAVRARENFPIRRNVSIFSAMELSGGRIAEKR